MTEEIIQDGHNGYLYELTSIQSLVEAMKKITTLKKSKKHELRRQSLFSIIHLTWEESISQIINQTFAK
jgi:glycosyltransferase involved in cell wall biosynthesis